MNYNYTEQELKAMAKCLEIANLDSSMEDIQHYTNCDYLTINNIKGHVVASYLDENKEVIIEVDTLKEIESLADIDNTPAHNTELKWLKELQELRKIISKQKNTRRL